MKESRVQAQIAELENQALRAQMNPHFIFNSLNSIRSLIMLDRKEEGVTYLTKFSRMVREILNHSKEKAIPLEKELELLRIYLDMESLRFHQKFNYQIQIDPNINLYAQKVPPLLIQPFVENSIWHGLMHKDGPAHLIIRLFLSDGFLFIIIEDNGIGREAAAQIKTNKSMYRKSSEGIKLSKSRIDLVSVHAEVIVDDLSEGGYASGTRVTIKLPICYGKKN
jgi:LytS/YehU family sensor histidine kinase